MGDFILAKFESLTQIRSNTVKSSLVSEEPFPEGPTIKKKIQSRSKFSVSPQKIGLRVGGSLEIFNLARNLEFFDLCLREGSNRALVMGF